MGCTKDADDVEFVSSLLSRLISLNASVFRGKCVAAGAPGPANTTDTGGGVGVGCGPDP